MCTAQREAEGPHPESWIDPADDYMHAVWAAEASAKSTRHRDDFAEYEASRFAEEERDEDDEYEEEREDDEYDDEEREDYEEDEEEEEDENREEL